jgi:NitT/TauT family transport system substrate-binding protein
MLVKRWFRGFCIAGILIILVAGIVIIPGCIRQKPLLRVATNLWPGYEMLYLARNLGYYNDLSIRLVEVPSTAVVTRNLRNGSIESGCLTLDEVLTLLQDDINLRVILVLDESCGGDVLMAKPGINDLQGLKGKRIGFENSTVSAVLLDAALEEGGVQISEIQRVEMSIDAHFRAYKSDQVDAVATYEPIRSQLLKEGAKILFSSAQIPGRILDVLVVRAEIMETHKEELKALLSGYFRALDYFRKHPREASLLMEKRLGKDPLPQFDGIKIPGLEENAAYLQGDSPKLNTTAQNLMSVMLKRKLLRHSFTFQKVAESEFLPIPAP